MTTWWMQNGLTSVYSTTVSMICYQHLHIAFIVKDIVYEGFRSHPPVVVCWTALHGSQYYDEIYSQRHIQYVVLLFQQAFSPFQGSCCCSWKPWLACCCPPGHSAHTGLCEQSTQEDKQRHTNMWAAVQRGWYNIVRRNGELLKWLLPYNILTMHSSLARKISSF